MWCDFARRAYKLQTNVCIKKERKYTSHVHFSWYLQRFQVTNVKRHNLPPKSSVDWSCFATVTIPFQLSPSNPLISHNIFLYCDEPKKLKKKENLNRLNHFETRISMGFMFRLCVCVQCILQMQIKFRVTIVTWQSSFSSTFGHVSNCSCQIIVNLESISLKSQHKIYIFIFMKFDCVVTHQKRWACRSEELKWFHYSPTLWNTNGKIYSPVPRENRTPPKNSLLANRSWSHMVNSNARSDNSSSDTSS